MNRKQRRSQGNNPPKASAPAPVQPLLEAAIQHHQAGRMGEAERIYRDILALDPRHADALHLLGVIALQAGRHAVAAGLIGQAVAINPGAAMYHSNHAVALKELGRLAEALVSYDAALRLKPDYVEVHSNRGNLLKSLGRADEALAAFDAALRVKPDHAQAHLNRGLVLHDFGHLGEARKSYERALLIRPDLAEAHLQRGNAFYDLGRFDEAIACHRRALRVRSDYTEACAELVPCLQQVCAWNEISHWQSELLRRIPDQGEKIQPFTLLSFDSTPAQQLTVAKQRGGSAEILPARPPHGGAKIRLGYLSGDFRSHPVAQLVAELIERHDRARFDVVGYSYGPDDCSPIRQRLSRGFDRFVDIRPLSHIDAAKFIRQDGIDILVDLTGHTHGARTQILAYRPAPVQVNFLGYPGTMGADFIDYIIADPVCIPPGEEIFFSETVVRLPDSYQPNDSRREIAPETAEWPERGFVFCCFNNSFKITPAIFAIWMRLLAKVPNSVLWLLDANITAKDNLRREAAKAGIAPERLVFAPRQPLPDHLARHRLADLFLDTLPYNAHTTASDALWTGLPVLTCRGETFAGRVAASLLTAVGMPELITSSLEEYEALAVALATDPARLASLKAKLAANRDTAPLFDTDRYARNIEAAYEQMWNAP